MNDRLTKLKNDHRYTYAQLQQLTGISSATLHNYCNGDRDLKNARAEHVYKIAKFFDVTIEYLLGIDEEYNGPHAD